MASAEAKAVLMQRGRPNGSNAVEIDKPADHLETQASSKNKKKRRRPPASNGAAITPAAGGFQANKPRALPTGVLEELGKRAGAT